MILKLRLITQREGERWFVLEKRLPHSMGFALSVALVPVPNDAISPCFLGFLGRFLALRG